MKNYLNGYNKIYNNKKRGSSFLTAEMQRTQRKDRWVLKIPLSALCISAVKSFFPCSPPLKHYTF